MITLVSRIIRAALGLSIDGSDDVLLAARARGAAGSAAQVETSIIFEAEMVCYDERSSKIDGGSELLFTDHHVAHCKPTKSSGAYAAYSSPLLRVGELALTAADSRSLPRQCVQRRVTALGTSSCRSSLTRLTLTYTKTETRSKTPCSQTGQTVAIAISCWSSSTSLA